MRLILFLTIYCLIYWGCNSKTEKKSETVDNTKSSKPVFGKKFFEYDAIDYYSNDMEESKIGELYDKQSKSDIDSFKMGIILGSIPKSISDLAFIDKLNRVGFKKSSIDKSKFADIDKIFVEKSVKQNFMTACINVYRDILIFKKNNEVIGTAKICFGCMANEITGSTVNTENFGMDGDYEKLAEIILK